MTEITEIRYTDPYFTVLLSTGERLKLPPELYSELSLSKGKIIDNEEYEHLKEESARLECRGKAFNYLAVRSRSGWEMRLYLIKKGFDKDIVEETVCSLKDKGYINDYDFAISFINSRKNSRIVGRNAIKRDLYKKGVSREIINTAIKKTNAGRIDPDDIYGLALKKYNSLDKKKNKLLKVVYFLKQKGFEEDQVRDAVDKLKKEGYK
ncbi:MAG: RecX family transcriptional regulator [Spirochaetota bacterium]